MAAGRTAVNKSMPASSRSQMLNRRSSTANASSSSESRVESAGLSMFCTNHKRRGRGAAVRLFSSALRRARMRRCLLSHVVSLDEPPLLLQRLHGANHCYDPVRAFFD